VVMTVMVSLNGAMVNLHGDIWAPRWASAAPWWR
jgi:hypothetical protein